MTKLFSLSELNQEQPVQEDKSALHRVSNILATDHKVKSLTDLLPSLPGKDQVFFLWTVNSFNAFTFIPHVLRHCGAISELVISTYSINIRIIDALAGYMNKGFIEQIFILVSDSAKYRIQVVMDHLEQFQNSNDQKVTVRYAWNHSKVTLIKTAEHHFIIEGSGNFSENSRHEQYVFLNNNEIYDFRKHWITDAIHGRTT